MQTVCIDATWEREITLGKKLIDYLKKQKVKSIALYASVQFLKVEKIKQQLADLNIEVKITKAKRTNVPMQILGCDAYHDSFADDIIATSDAVLYIGDGMFHPKALLLSQIYKKEQKPVLIWDPVVEKMKIIDENDIKKQIGKMKANLQRYIAAKTIGIIVTTKPGQQYIKAAHKLKELLATQDKKSYIFIDDTINISLFENYPFIDAWVNTACPRIGTDDITTTAKPLINIKDAFDPIAVLQKLH